MSLTRLLSRSLCAPSSRRSPWTDLQLGPWLAASDIIIIIIIITTIIKAVIVIVVEHMSFSPLHPLLSLSPSSLSVCLSLSLTVSVCLSLTVSVCLSLSLTVSLSNSKGLYWHGKHMFTLPKQVWHKAKECAYSCRYYTVNKCLRMTE